MSRPRDELKHWTTQEIEELGQIIRKLWGQGWDMLSTHGRIALLDQKVLEVVLNWDKPEPLPKEAILELRSALREANWHKRSKD
jgi:hypothetical protein